MLKLKKRDILSSALNEEKEVRCKYGIAGVEGGGEGDNLLLYGQAGFISRPPDPEGNRACTVLVAQDGNNTYGVGSFDSRLTKTYGELEGGGVALCSWGDAQLLAKKSNHSISQVTKNQADGSIMVDQLNGADGLKVILVSGPGGSTVLNMTDSKVIFGVNGGAQIVLEGSTATIIADSIALQGNCALGVMPGNIPIPPTNGVAYTVAGPVNVISTQVVVAP